MLIKDVLLRDPSTHPLINQGQARIVDTSNQRALEELRGELSTFVCEGQFAHGIHSVINSFLYNSGRTSQKAAWISGFYGSGKSHLLKMLSHIWSDTVFPDGATARSLIPEMPDDLRSLLRELDTAGKRSGGLLSAAGALPRGSTDHVRLTILSVIFRAVGLPSGYPQARFCTWLQSRGFLDSVKQAVEEAGRSFETELNNLYVSGPIAKALLNCDPNFASNELAARETIRQQFPARTSDITTDEFLSTLKETLRLGSKDPARLPCTLIVLDEVQQYIGESHDRSMLVTEVVESISKELDSHAIVVGAGQMALTEVPLLQKLMDRFTINIPLSDAEVETVTRKVLLAKQQTAVPAVRECLSTYAGEVSRQLQGTRIGETTEDQGVLAEDYPLLPTRRRFWEQCFRQIDAAGTHSQLRSQLRIIHDAVAKLSAKELGCVIPGDELFEALAPEMVNTGVLLREINERILSLAKDGTDQGRLSQRICGLVFLIGKLKRDSGADLGVRATKEHIADLLIDNLKADNGKLRNDVAKALDDLSKNGTLMVVGDEYRLQTREGSEWDREFRNFQTRLGSDEPSVQFKRDQLLYAHADKLVRSVTIVQGTAKVARQLAISREQVPPITDGLSIPVWIRDGWSSMEKDLLDAARAAGADSSIIYIFIPRLSAEDLRRLTIEADAAQQTLALKGNPTTDEGREAKQSMDSRYSKAVTDRDRLVQEIVANSKVFQGGGSEVIRNTLEERVREAANDAVIRLYPRFKDADSNGWESVIKRAKEGADQPFKPVGHNDATEKHKVCQQVLITIGAGKSGTDIRKQLRGIGFGWPQDSIDAALIALHRLQHISASLNGNAILPGQLDQNKIAKAEFRVEHTTLSLQDRLHLRKLFVAAGVTVKNNDELVLHAPEFLKRLKTLAIASGGNPPLPPVPQISEIDDMERLVGNEQLSAIRQKAEDIEKNFKEWAETAERAEKRKPIWDMLEQLAKHAGSLDTAKQILIQLDAIRDQRSLLEANDPLPPIRGRLVDILRTEVNRLFNENQSAYATAVSALQSDEVWQSLALEDQKSILAATALTVPAPPDVSSDEAVLAELNSRNLQNRHTEIDAIPGRVKQAFERAAKAVEPHVRTINVERSTLRSKDDVEKWVERQRKKLIEAIENGPVLIG